MMHSELFYKGIILKIMSSELSNIQVYYDGKCGLCRREIDFYRRRADDGSIEWIDVTNPRLKLNTTGLSDKDLLMHLHVFSGEQVYRGVDAFIEIWMRVPGWNTLANIVARQPFRWIAECCYEIFARVRFKLYPHCRITEQ